MCRGCSAQFSLDDVVFFLLRLCCKVSAYYIECAASYILVAVEIKSIYRTNNYLMYPYTLYPLTCPPPLCCVSVCLYGTQLCGHAQTLCAGYIYVLYFREGYYGEIFCYSVHNSTTIRNEHFVLKAREKALKGLRGAQHTIS